MGRGAVAFVTGHLVEGGVIRACKSADVLATGVAARDVIASGTSATSRATVIWTVICRSVSRCTAGSLDDRIVPGCAAVSLFARTVIAR